MLAQIDIGPVLVTGGAGFLGARLVRRLAAGSADVHLIVRPTTALRRIEDLGGRLHLHTCDLAHLDSLTRVVREIAPRVVFHLAATGSYGTGDPGQLFRDNVLATSNLLMATAGLPRCRLIHTASSAETTVVARPVREDDPVLPIGPYGQAKAASTLLASVAARSGRLIVILKPFAVYGPGEPESRLIPTAIRAAMAGSPLRLTTPGYTRDYVYVDDVVEAYVLAATTEGVDGQLFNVATGRATTNEAVVGLIAQLVGRSIAIESVAYPARATDRSYWCADVTKVRTQMGWHATRDLASGLAQCLAARAAHVDA